MYTMMADTGTSVRSGIHCLSTTGKMRVLRPFGPAVHVTVSNGLFQFGYIGIYPIESDGKYVLLLSDDHSNYKWAFAFSGTSAENAARAIID